MVSACREKQGNTNFQTMWTVPVSPFLLLLCLCQPVLALPSQPVRAEDRRSASSFSGNNVREDVGTARSDSLPVPQFPQLFQGTENYESRLADQFGSEVMRGQDSSLFSAYRHARRKQDHQRPGSSRDEQSSLTLGPGSFFFEASNEPRHSLFRSANTTVFQRAAYQFFLKMLCPQQTKEAEELRFNAAKFVADIDNNYNFVVDTKEGNPNSDRAILKLPDWLSEATSGYRQSLEAAFAMFDLFDIDRSGYLSRLDFTHWLIDTDMDRAVSVCEELNHVNKVARLSEYYASSILRKQGRVLWNKLYDPNFAPPPVVPPEVPPTASSIADVTVNSTVRSDEVENGETVSNIVNTTNGNKNNNSENMNNNTRNGTLSSSEAPLFPANIPEYITRLSTTDIDEREQKLTSEPPPEVDQRETTVATSLQADEDDLDLHVQGLFKFIG